MKTLYFLSSIAFTNCFYIGNEPANKDKIVDGENIEIKYAPYQASLLRFGYYYCGGTIIDKLWILTAAHCINLNTGPVTKTSLMVRTGTSSLTATGVRYNVEEIIVHPQFNPKNYDNDITLIKLKEPIEFSSEQKSIPLAQPGDKPYVGNVMRITGFGKVGEHYGYSRILKVAYVPVIDFKSCEKAYYRDPITKNMFCAGDGRADACQGDSGGPGVINDKLAGVVSSGIGCESKLYPGIYTRVDKYYDWIMQSTNKLSSLLE